MKKRMIAYLIASATFLSQLCTVSVPSFGEEAVLFHEIEGDEMNAAEDFAAVSVEDDDTIMMSAEEEFSVENDVPETESEEILEEMTASDDDSGEEAAIDPLGLIEDDALQAAESDLFDGILMAAADPEYIQADLSPNPIPRGSQSSEARYRVSIETSGIYHFVGTGIAEFAFWKDEIIRIDPEGKIPQISTDGKLITGLYLEAGNEYLIGATFDVESGVDSGSFYCYRSEYCVQIPNNSITDEESLSSLQKNYTYRDVSGAIKTYSSSVNNTIVDVCHDGAYFFLAKNDQKENSDGTYSVLLQDPFTGEELGHFWGEGEIKTAANCAHTGTMQHTCLCGESLTKTIPKTAHRWGAFNANGDRTCSVCKIKQHDESKVAYGIAGSPAKVKLKAAGSRKLTVKWKKPAKSKLKKIKGFYIEVATDSSFKNIVKTKKVKKSKTSFTFKKLKKGTRYYVHVRFYKGSQISRWSAVKNKKVK